MVRSHLHCALASVAALLLSSGATAQSSQAAPPAKGNAAATTQHAVDKPTSGDKSAAEGKTDPKGDLKADAKGKTADPAAKEADRAVRLKVQHDAERERLRGLLQAPMTETQKQDLRRHAQRVAKLERIKALALDAKDSATAERADKLLEKENARHEKWMSSLSAKTETAADTQAKGGAR
jgi:hypothetical protein